MTSARTWTRPTAHAALAVGLAIAVTALGGAPGAVADAVEDSRVESAAGWLAAQLVDGHVKTAFDLNGDGDTDDAGETFDDHGATADAIFALDASGTAQSAASDAAAWLASNATTYIDGGTAGDEYAGSYAKLLNVALAQGAGTDSYVDGVDLVAELSALECGTAARTDCAPRDDGRFSDRLSSDWDGDNLPDDYSNAFGQSFALIGLHRATGSAPSTAVQFLVGQQCDDGSFPLTFHGASCSADTDATALAAQALLEVAADGTAGADAAAEALDWLVTQEGDPGQWSGSGPTALANTNTTGLVAQAFIAAGDAYSGPAERAQGWLSALQVDCADLADDDASWDADDLGSVRYSADDSGDALRATTQALPAIAGVRLAAVTAEGATAAAPVADCAEPTPTDPTDPTEPTEPAEPSTDPTPAPTVVAVGDEDLTDGGTVLARTGATSPALLGTGALLVAAGSAFLLAVRRRPQQ